MEEDLDLRPYLGALARRWWVILGVTLPVMLIGLSHSALQPAVYDASSMILISQHDPADTKTFAAFATSDQILQSVVEAYRPPAEAQVEEWSAAGLAAMVTAHPSASEPSLLSLHVQGRSPQVCAAIARKWAEVVIVQGNETYNNPAPELKALEDLSASDELSLAAANAALAEFQGRNQISTLMARLNAQQSVQKDTLSTQATLDSDIAALQGLRGWLGEQPVSQRSDVANPTALLLQAYTTGTGLSLPANLAASLPNLSRDDQLAILDKLLADSRSRSTDGADQIAARQAQILDLQRNLQGAQTELDTLTGRQKQAEQAYLAAVRKRDEARLAGQKPNQTFRIQRDARLPRRPVSPRPLRSGALALIAGLILGMLTAFAVDRAGIEAVSFAAFQPRRLLQLVYAKLPHGLTNP